MTRNDLSELIIEGKPGSIKFDGKNIGEIPLSQLRSSISIIPQEPIIFSETVRKNLDPTGKYSDENLWSVLQKVQLKNFIAEKSEKLDFQLAEQGANLRCVLGQIRVKRVKSIFGSSGRLLIILNGPWTGGVRPAN